MSQTPAGAIKFKETMIKKFGSQEAWAQYMRENGRKGGTLSVGGGFAFGENGRKFGALGGSRSKRGYKFLCENDEYMEYMDKSKDHYGETVRFPK